MSSSSTPAQAARAHEHSIYAPPPTILLPSHPRIRPKPTLPRGEQTYTPLKSLKFFVAHIASLEYILPIIKFTAANFSLGPNGEGVKLYQVVKLEPVESRVRGPKGKIESVVNWQEDGKGRWFGNFGMRQKGADGEGVGVKEVIVEGNTLGEAWYEITGANMEFECSIHRGMKYKVWLWTNVRAECGH